MFDIQFQDPPDVAVGAARGVLSIGGFEEHFESSLQCWDMSDYGQHWREAILRIVRGASSTALITSCTDPRSSNFIVWWPGYRIGDGVTFQQQLLFLDDLSSEIDLEDPFPHVPLYEPTTEEGVPISEWRASLRDLEDFLDRG